MAKKTMSWEYVAKMCEDVYGIYVDWEEKFFICPECDEPIYECDFDDFSVCPVCEFEWEDAE